MYIFKQYITSFAFNVFFFSDKCSHRNGSSSVTAEAAEERPPPGFDDERSNLLFVGLCCFRDLSGADHLVGCLSGAGPLESLRRP